MRLSDLPDVDLSIIIVTWNNANEILDCLSSLYRHADGLGLEVFLVDNASQDNTLALVRENYSQVVSIANEKNMGFAAANNQAIEIASGRNLLLLNPDTSVQQNALSTMVKYADGQASVGAIGPCLVRPDGQIQKSCFRFTSVLSILYGYLFGGVYVPKDLQNPTQVQSLAGAALMVKREVLAQVGPLDTDYFMYGEDNDWCYRIHRAGWEIHYLPSARIVHVGGQSARLVPVQTYVRRHVAKLVFAQKHRRPWEYRILLHLMRLNIQINRLKAEGSIRRYYKDVLATYDHEIRTLEKGLHSV